MYGELWVTNISVALHNSHLIGNILGKKKQQIALR